MQRSLLSIAPLVVGLVAGGSLEVHDRGSFDGVERVKVRWAAGEIRVDTHDASTVEVTKLAWGPEAPLAYHARQDAEILVLELLCRTPAPCGGDLALTLPSGVSLEVDLGEGEAILDGPLGDLSVVVGNGAIQATDLVAAEAVLQVVDGDIQAEWAAVPLRVVIATVDGDAALRLPEGEYDLVDELGHSTLTGLRQVDGAASRIQVTTLGGSADIRGTRSVAAL